MVTWKYYESEEYIVRTRKYLGESILNFIPYFMW